MNRGTRKQSKESKKEAIEKWRKALQSTERLIESAFEDGRTSIMKYNDLVSKLKNMSISADDIDDVIDEAERKKLILVILPESKGEHVSYLLVDSVKRKEELLKTKALLKLVDKIYLNRSSDRLAKDEVGKELKSNGLSDEDIKRAIYEAQRDHILLDSFRDGKSGYTWIPPEERKLEPERRRVERWFFHKWMNKKARQNQL